MSKIIVCPFCEEYVGYYPEKEIGCIENIYTGETRSVELEYARCARCGRMFPNPSFKEYNQDQIDEASKSIFKKLS